MNVSLSRELEKFIHAKVQSGRYNSASEVIREALRLLEERETSRAAELGAFNEELGRRLASLNRGGIRSSSEARARLKRKSEERRSRVHE